MKLTGSGELLMRDDAGRLVMQVSFSGPRPQMTVYGLDRNVAVQALTAWLDRAMRDIRVGTPVR